jgi:alcohol dehydrogenase class IV
MDVLDYFEFIATPRIVYGPDSLERIGKVCKRLGCAKPFLVIDRIFVDAGIDKTIEKAMAAEQTPLCGMLTDIPPDSDLAVITSGYKQAAEAGADLIIALGGGSTLDTAKGLRVMLGMGGVLPEGVNVITKPLPPLVAIPTTAGTGSESTTAAVIRDKERGLKLSYTDAALAPTIALLDPKLTVTMPKSITAGTGMDALSHAVEALHSTNSQLVSDGLALQAIRLISRSLPRVLEDGADLEARGEMLLAATMAGLAFSNTLVGLAHAAAHATGAAFRMPHGAACGLFLPYTMEFNMDVAKEAYAEVARAMGIDTTGMGPLEAAREAVATIRMMHVQAGLPASLKDAGVPRDGIEIIMEKTLKDGSMITNPKQPTEPQLKAFLTKAWLGEPPCGAPAPAVEAERKQAAEKQKPAEKKPEKKPDEIAPLDLTLDQMYEYYSRLFNKLLEIPAVSQALAKSGIIVQFVYSNEKWDKDALFTIDCSGGGVKLYTRGEGPKPQVGMLMSSDTAHRFWLQKLDLMTAINKQDIVLQGNLNEVMGLLPSILPGFAIYAALEKERKSKPVKKADDIAPLDLTLDQMYTYYSKLFSKLLEIPPVSQALIKSGIIVQFVYSNEKWDKDALFTIDCSGEGVTLFTKGEGPKPQVAMLMSSDTAHRFWLQKLDLMTAINKQDIVLQGNLNEVMGLLPSIMPGFAIYAELEKERAAQGVAGDEDNAPVTEQQMLETIKAFSGKLFSLPEVVAPLQKSGIKIRFAYFNETWDNDVVLTADCGRDPIAVEFGATDIEPSVTMRMHSDTARAFWLQKLNLMSAVTKGDITVQGNISEAMALLPAIRPGFALFKEVDGGE